MPPVRIAKSRKIPYEMAGEQAEAGEVFVRMGIRRL